MRYETDSFFYCQYCFSVPVMRVSRALLLMLLHSPASASLYDVVMDDIDWQLYEQEHFKCRLYQKVPLFGGLAIIAKAGHLQSIELQSSLFPTRPESVQLWIKPQPWGGFYSSGHSSKGAYEVTSDSHQPVSYGQRLQVTDYYLSDDFSGGRP